MHYSAAQKVVTTKHVVALFSFRIVMVAPAFVSAFDDAYAYLWYCPFCKDILFPIARQLGSEQVLAARWSYWTVEVKQRCALTVSCRRTFAFITAR